MLQICIIYIVNFAIDEIKNRLKVSITKDERLEEMSNAIKELKLENNSLSERRVVIG